MEAGTLFGPASEVYHIQEDGGRPGFVACCVPNPLLVEDSQNPRVDWDDLTTMTYIWINAWCSDNRRGERVGVSYCKVVIRDKSLEPEDEPEPAVEASSEDKHPEVEEVHEPRMFEEEEVGVQGGTLSSEPSLELAADAASEDDLTLDPVSDEDTTVTPALT